jgi:adenylate cyclase
MTTPSTAPAAGPSVILVVDDESDLQSLVSLRFRKAIRAGEIRFHFAQDGVQALEKLAEHPDIEIVVTDINMPNMDGLSLVLQLRSRHPMVKAVIVSAYGDMGNIRDAMNRGAFDFLMKPLDFSDFEKTVFKTLEHVRTIRATVRSLEENRILRMFVDESALHFMLRNKDQGDGAKTEQVECSVAFVDICSFTALSERQPPGVVIGLLNTYFEAIVGAVQPEGGVLDKFIGDAAMVTFQGDDHRMRAARACLRVRETIRLMRGEVESAIGFFPNVAIGLDGGEVLSGPVGAASLRRLDFTVIGDVVNTAARLQGAAGPGEVIVSDRFVRPICDRLTLVDRGVRSFKGKSEPMQVWALEGSVGVSGHEG